MRTVKSTFLLLSKHIVYIYNSSCMYYAQSTICTMQLQVYYTSTQYTRVKTKPCTMDIKYVLPLHISLQSENKHYITHRSCESVQWTSSLYCLIICYIPPQNNLRSAHNCNKTICYSGFNKKKMLRINNLFLISANISSIKFLLIFFFLH